MIAVPALRQQHEHGGSDHALIVAALPRLLLFVTAAAVRMLVASVDGVCYLLDCVRVFAANSCPRAVCFPNHAPVRPCRTNGDAQKLCAGQSGAA